VNTPSTLLDEELRALLIEARFNIQPGDSVDGVLLVERPEVKLQIDHYLESDEARMLSALFKDCIAKRDAYVIGEDVPLTPTSSGIWKEVRLQNILRSAQRQRAKQWDEGKL